MDDITLQLPCSLVQGAPTEETPGFIGAFVMDISDAGRGNVYKCIDKGDSGCVWTLITGGGGGGGQNGITPHIGSNGNWYIGDNDTGVKAKGEDGYTPVKGKDYYTESDKAEMVQDVLAALPTWEGGSY